LRCKSPDRPGTRSCQCLGVFYTFWSSHDCLMVYFGMQRPRLICKTVIIRAHQFFAKFANGLKSRN